MPEVKNEFMVNSEELRQKLSEVGKNKRKVDGDKLARGKALFVDDIKIPADKIYHAKILHSPHAHAIIKKIDAAKALALPGVVGVFSHENVPRVPFTTAGQNYPEPSPYDTFVFDSKVRFAGDRVCAVLADSPDTAARALDLIKVEYEPLPAILNMREAIGNKTIIHDELDSTGIFDKNKNIAAHVQASMGDIEKGFKEADHIFENEYSVQYVQAVPLEPHIAVTYYDENDRLVIYCSTQVPFHSRRIVAQVLGMPVQKVRVIKPRTGGSFGVKQEILIEDLCAMLTHLTKKAVKLEYTRHEEFCAARTRHPQIATIKSGFKKDGTITALSMKLLANTGAYGSHALTVQCNTGSKSLCLYNTPNVNFEATIVYTNLPVAGALRGYGGPQGYFPLDSHFEECAKKLNIDSIELRRKNQVKVGDDLILTKALGEGREGYMQVLRTCGMQQCLDIVLKDLDYYNKKKEYDESNKKSHIKRGVGLALTMHGSGIPGVDMGAASIKMNDDGSFNLLCGATDLGTGSDTILSQIAAEVLKIPTDKIIIYSSDTDMTPFDVGAYASSTTYISGVAIAKAAAQCREQILKTGAHLLKEDIADLYCQDSAVHSTKTKASVSYQDIALYTLYKEDQYQIIGTGSHLTYDCPPPFCAQGCELEVDTETGVIKLIKFSSAVDCGLAINPVMAEGQIEGGVHMGLGYALCEEMKFDAKGVMANPCFLDYKLLSPMDMPEIKTHLVETFEPTGPFGAKSVSEIPVDGPAPAVANAIEHACGIRIYDLPITAEKLLNAITELNKK